MSWRAFMEDLGSTAMDRGYMPPNMNNIEELAAQLSSSDADDVSPLAVGTGVRVKGLRSRPDLNGKTGRVVRAFDGSTGRCGILIEGEPKPKALRPDNVELVTTAQDRVNALICNLDCTLANSGMNWLRVFSFLEEKERITGPSAACVAFLHGTGALKRTAIMGSKMGAEWGRATVQHPLGAPSSDIDIVHFLRCAHRRFPALCDVAVDASGCGQYLTVNQNVGLEDLFTFPSLTKLTLNHIRCTSLPDSIGALTGLTVLKLFNNALETLPDSIGALTGLTELNLNENALTALPDSIGKLTNLTKLRLFNNELTALPESIGALTALTLIQLRQNKLATLPETFGALIGLTKLVLWRNPLTALPNSITALTNLTSLGFPTSLSTNTTFMNEVPATTRCWITTLKHKGCDITWNSSTGERFW